MTWLQPQQRQSVEDALKNSIAARGNGSDLAQPGQEHHVRAGNFEGCGKHRDDSGIPEELSPEVLNCELDQVPHVCLNHFERKKLPFQ